jgi:hypothetical protein
MFVATRFVQPFSRLVSVLLLACALGFLPSCAESAVNAPQLRIWELDGPALNRIGRGEPVWLAFKKGEKVPLQLLLHGLVQNTEPDRAIMLEVQRDFFLLVSSDDVPRISYDGVHPVKGGGSFRFGISNTKEGGAHVEVELVLGRGGEDG